MLEVWLIGAVTMALLLGLLSLVSVMIGQRLPQIVATLRPATVRGVLPPLHCAA